MAFRTLSFKRSDYPNSQSIITDMEKIVKQPRKLKRGYDLYEWIEQEMPAYREKLVQEASFGDPDEIKNTLIDVLHGHIRAVLHPGDTVRLVLIKTVSY